MVPSKLRIVKGIVLINDPIVSYMKEQDVERFKSLSGIANLKINMDEVLCYEREYHSGNGNGEHNCMKGGVDTASEHAAKRYGDSSTRFQLKYKRRQRHNPQSMTAFPHVVPVLKHQSEKGMLEGTCKLDRPVMMPLLPIPNVEDCDSDSSIVLGGTARRGTVGPPVGAMDISIVTMVRVKLPAKRVDPPPPPPPRVTRKRKADDASCSMSRDSHKDKEPIILDDFNDALFYNPEAETLFQTKFSLKKIELEKEVLVEKLCHLPMIAKFNSRGWGPLLHHLTPPPESVVKEFYSNFFNVHDSCFSTYIRGQVIEISPPFLAEKIGIPFIENPMYPYKASTCPPLSTIVSFLMQRTIRGFSRKEFPGKFLAKDHVIPARIIFTNIFPNIHLSTFTFERIRFLYAFLNNDSIDLATNICEHMIDIFQSNSGSLKLRYGCLIMRLLTAVGISFSLSETRLGPLKTIGIDTLKKSKSHKRNPTPSYHSDMSALPDAIKLLLDRSSSIQSAITTLQSDVAVIRLELSQVRADIKLLQPPTVDTASDADVSASDNGSDDMEDADESE